MQPDGLADKFSIGCIDYITGGTARQPRLIRYSQERWFRSVYIMQRVFVAHGLNQHATFVCCHPMAPWAIGPVHVEGALACGARVLPLGLSVLQEGIQAILVKESPTHICGSARTLLRVAREIREKLFLDPRSLGIQKLFVAGERLSESIRSLLHQEWGGEVVNIYGMAEFDTIASEFPDLKGLVLMPEFEYMVQDEAGLSQKLLPGVSGELLVRENCSMDWHATHDYVEVIDSLAIDLYDWVPVQSIKVNGRSDLSVVLSDGSVLGAIHIEQLLDVIPGLSQLQVQVVREESNEILRIVYRNCDVIHPVSEAHILNTLKVVNVDLADSLEKGVVKDVIFDSAEYSWIVTARGKLPLVVEI